MTDHRTNRNTWLFLGFLLLAGLANMTGRMLPPLWDSLMTCLHNVIYIGLLIFWLESVRIRLLPSRARTYMYAAACFMLMYMLLRFFAYNLALTAEASRYARYAYWILQTMIPALFLMICIRIRRGEQTQGKWNEALLLIPAGLLSLMALTNDLHTLVYVPQIPLSQFTVASGTYGYQIGFYLLNAWMILAVFVGLIVLLAQAGRLPRRTILFFAGDIALWFGILLLDILYLDPHTSIHIFNAPETNIFGMLGIFEISIRGRLIPNNENYAGFFSHLQMPVLITDRDLHPVYPSAVPLAASPEQMTAALASPVYPDGDTRLSGKAIQAGYAFWAEDESALHRLNEELVDANDTIALENELLLRERKQIMEKAIVDQRNAIYVKAARAVYPTQKKVDTLLTEAEPDTPSFRPLIAEALALSAYVKRKFNFVMIESESQAITAEELKAAIVESSYYFAYCGLSITEDIRTNGNFPCGEAIAVYDRLEAVFEALCGNASECLVRLEDRRVLCMADCETAPELSFPVSAHMEDGQLLLSWPLGGDAV